MGYLIDTGQGSHQMTSSSNIDPFATLKELLRNHESKDFHKFMICIRFTYAAYLRRRNGKINPKVSWVEVVNRVKEFQSVRGDVFPKNSKAARVEFLLSLYSPTNPFNFNSLEDAESLGLESRSMLSLRVAVGRFRLATRERWLRVQQLRDVSDTYADILPEKLPLFIKSVEEALKSSEESLPPRFLSSSNISPLASTR
ncbi:hypothetical protein CROQUDRAFT_602246 [Cronartium quercuum f. sp. fusiforme G11]|uniref:Uncharacterized protein n=1 Tax=Cronartium quercuum f. sp. fusiforme G11 TaxID=708437 RepID=A0A9P6NVG2_9BASI|nr:hypothetical protein CROQUDRAFT_602246 [Cronartium quercuum f. sp. fusiforme G11]